MIPKDDHVVYDGNIDFSKGIEFKISANKFMFNTLRKEIYTNPVDSTVREVISNAIDSQVPNNKKDVPITIILNEQLVVKDSGTGITPEKMVMIASYGESDKRESNDQVGAFGLGFKSPFSIADQFVVSTIYEQNNSRWSINYVCSLDDKGGRIYPLNEPSPTKEKTGTTIKIPIKKEYQDTVKASIVKYCSYLNPRPKVYFNDNSQVEWPKVVEETDLFVLYDSPQNYNILYNMIPYKVYISNYPNYVNNIPGLIYKFNIGELELPASRETIRVTTTLNNKIRSSFNFYKDYVKKKVDEDFVKLTKLDDVIDFMCQIEYHHFFLDLTKFKFGEISLNLRDIYNVSRDSRRNSYNGSNISYKDLKKYKILSIESKEKLETKGYHKIKIGYYVKNVENKLLVNFLDNPNPLLELMKDKTITLADIKLPKPPKREKTGEKKYYRIQTAFRGHNRFHSVDITYGKYLYDTRNIPISLGNEYKACYVDPNSRLLKKIQKLPNWFTVDELFKEQLTASKIKEEDVEELAIYTGMNELYQPIFSKPDAKRHESLIKFAQANGKISNTEVDKKREAMYDRYPMLKYVDPYRHNKTEFQKHVNHYIQLLDERKK